MADDNIEHREFTASAADAPAEAGVDDASLTDEQRLELRRRRARATAVDDADASHEGGMGAQGAAVDFGEPKNFGLPE